MTSERFGSRRGVLRTLAGTPVVWLAACGANGGGSNAAPAAALPPSTIEYMHYAAAGGSQAQGREESAKKFMATAPNIKVNITAIAPSAMMLEKFKTTAAAGTPPDLL